MIIEVEQKYLVGSVVIHKERKSRINAFRYEVRPMGVLKVYECTDEATGRQFEAVQNTLKY